MTETHPTPVATGHHPVAARRTLHAIAGFEFIKGLAAFAGAVGVFDLAHRDVRHLVMELIGHFGLNPDARYPSLLLHYADLLPNADVRALLGIAAAYVMVRWVEAYGLWNDRAWGEWLGALSGGIYVPFELQHLMHRPSLTNAGVLLLNLFMVGFLAWQLWRRR